jgi:hypothetical protein
MLLFVRGVIVSSVYEARQAADARNTGAAREQPQTAGLWTARQAMPLVFCVAHATAVQQLVAWRSGIVHVFYINVFESGVILLFTTRSNPRP